MYIAIKIWKQLNQVSMVKIFLGLTMGSRYKEGNCSVVVLAKVGTLRSRTRRLLGRGDRAKAWNEDGVVSAGNFKLRFATRWGSISVHY